MVELTDKPIDSAAALQQTHSTQAGAVVVFVGTTREFTGERQTQALKYECYPEMAERKLGQLEHQARDRWPIIHCVIIHRLGHLELGEASILVSVSTPHRRDAFEAAQWLMDRIKEEVPIWKQENWTDGTTEWVHPGLPPSST
ncbi:MAG: molybdenum cofactor biosynthesis protein MoaE [Pirellulaceae bacterium]|nr:molybdenum cofactor biosynthesis protein MoaE [Pirellulaceae bacterium]